MEQYAPALEYYDAAHTLYTTLDGTQRERAGCLLNAGDVLHSLGRRGALRRCPRPLRSRYEVNGLSWLFPFDRVGGKAFRSDVDL
ncbi:hypothetical protein [Actinomyces respiraculi]|uniref:hypothetical protein n=1 Tax=Actinomyces respiraculi TaxID=2744574 RepID=UPI00141F640C|nr:hypothetical protein [Actinomyces respiraculi]